MKPDTFPDKQTDTLELPLSARLGHQMLDLAFPVNDFSDRTAKILGRVTIALGFIGVASASEFLINIQNGQ